MRLRRCGSARRVAAIAFDRNSPRFVASQNGVFAIDRSDLA